MTSQHRLYYINTLNKLEGSNENFSYTVGIPEHENYDRVVVLNASIPNTFYLIQEGINTFTLRENGVDTIITIPPGNYSAKVFALVLVPLMNAASPNVWIYSMALPNQNLEASTGKFTYTVTGNSSQPAIVCTNKVNEQLGFAVNSVNNFVDNKLESATTVNFIPESTLFIHSNISSAGDSDVLQEIYANNTQTLSCISYQCTAPELYSKALSTRLSSVFHFSLTNEKSQLLNLHGVDMQITLCLYKKDDTNDRIAAYIGHKVEEIKKSSP